jgi:hypothetical protein
MKFKIGDKVKRINESHRLMKVGDVDTVVRCTSSYVTLKNFGNGHAPYNLEKVESWKQRLSNDGSN